MTVDIDLNHLFEIVFISYGKKSLCAAYVKWGVMLYLPEHGVR